LLCVSVSFSKLIYLVKEEIKEGLLSTSAGDDSRFKQGSVT